jgi:formylglycine-generating enzyme required for sulfatase activity
MSHKGEEELSRRQERDLKREDHRTPTSPNVALSSMHPGWYVVVAVIVVGFAVAIWLVAGSQNRSKVDLDVGLPGGYVLKLKRIEPGRFQMGSPRSEQEAAQEATIEEKFAAKTETRPLALRDWAAQERQHDVEITRPFYIGVFEVTQGQYEAVMKRNPSYFSANGPDKELLKDLDTASFPVDGVSWDDAVEFCRRLSDVDGRTFDLPTEAEWEYACRAGATTMFAFGNTLSKRQANYLGVKPTTAPVGSFEANAFGLYDMHGNVSEWCKDWYERDYYSKSPRVDPTGPLTGIYRVIRGGCLNNPTVFCRSAARDFGRPDRAGDREKGDVYGFRIVMRE